MCKRFLLIITVIVLIIFAGICICAAVFSSKPSTLTYEEAEIKLLEHLADHPDIGSMDIEHGNPDTQEIYIKDGQEFRYESAYNFSFYYNENMSGLEDRLAGDYAISLDGKKVYWYDPANDWHVDYDNLRLYDNGAGESEPAVSEEALPSDFETARTDGTVPVQEEVDDISTDAAPDEDDDRMLPDVNDLRARPDGKEVTIFADNTFDCDYSGYKKIGYDFENLHRSVMAPVDWYGYRFYRDEPVFENMLTGTPIYDGPVPVKIDSTDVSTLFAAKPLTKSVFFFAQSPWIHAQDFINSDGLIDKYDHETYIDKKGRSMQVYFLDGLPKYACYDDFFSLCVWFNLKSEEQIPIVVNMINSIEVSLSSDAKFTLYQAEKLGYTIIPPEE